MAKSKNNNALVGAIVFASLVIAGSIVFFAMQLGETGNIGSDADFQKRVIAAIDNYMDEQNDPVNLAGDSPVLGDEDAPLTIIEWSDYQCWYCQFFYSDVLPLVKENYIDTGKVKLVYKDFPSEGHPAAAPAAALAGCVEEELGDEAFFKMHDRIFDTIADGFDPDALIAYGAELGMDEEELSECYESGDTRGGIYQDISAGRQIGVKGTPSFLVGDEFVRGAAPYKEISAIIEKKLAELDQ